MISALRHRIICRPLFDPDRIGSIIVPDQAKSRSIQGIVYKVGEGVPDIKEGDHVFYGAYDGELFYLEGELFIILHYRTVYAILNEVNIDIPGLYFKTKDGDYFGATYETVIKFIQMAFQEGNVTERFRQTQFQKQEGRKLSYLPEDEEDD